MQENKELKLAWDFVENTGTSMFLTGKAGTGKTTFLKRLKEESSKRMIVVAPTGVAAINAGGVTIHSFFQLPLSPFIPGTSFRDRYDFSKEKRRIIRTLDMLVIDEISMVRSDLLDAVDTVLRRYRDHTQPFGGIQLLMIGDLQQLTPVLTPQDEEMLKPHYDTPYFFGSHALRQINYVTIQLTHVYRQQDTHFIDILNHIREGKVSVQDLESLNKRYLPQFTPKAQDGYIRLTTHNRLADSYNHTELTKLTTQRQTYRAIIKDDFPEYSYPADVELELKMGAQVMFIKNDISGAHRYYNGKIGHVVALDENTIEVRCPGEKETIKVEPLEWENTKYVINEQTRVIEPQVQGVFVQYPLRLAWAITIHKSQGLTFERAIIDAGKSFASGQVYVALSRCKSLEGLVLATPIAPHNVINDFRVSAYIEHQQQAAEQSIKALPTLKEAYFRLQLIDLFDFSTIERAEQLVHRTLLEYFKGNADLTRLHAETVNHIKEKMTDVARKWQSLIRTMPSADLRDEAFLERIKRGASYFVDVLEAELSHLLEITKSAKCQNKKAMELMDDRYKDLWLNYLAKDKLLRRMEEEDFDVATYMLAKQETMLDAMDVVIPGSTKRRTRKKKKTTDSPFADSDKPKTERHKKGETAEMTYNMLLEGKSPHTIAEERGLKITTIYGHLSHYIKSGKLSADKVIEGSKVKAIRHAISQLPETATLSEVKAICREDITWDEIRLMMQSK